MEVAREWQQVFYLMGKPKCGAARDVANGALATLSVPYGALATSPINGVQPEADSRECETVVRTFPLVRWVVSGYEWLLVRWLPGLWVARGFR
jgi:hypothetical protein